MMRLQYTESCHTETASESFVIDISIHGAPAKPSFAMTPTIFSFQTLFFLVSVIGKEGMVTRQALFWCDCDKYFKTGLSVTQFKSSVPSLVVTSGVNGKFSVLSHVKFSEDERSCSVGKGQCTKLHF